MLWWHLEFPSIISVTTSAWLINLYSFFISFPSLSLTALSSLLFVHLIPLFFLPHIHVRTVPSTLFFQSSFLYLIPFSHISFPSCCLSILPSFPSWYYSSGAKGTACYLYTDVAIVFSLNTKCKFFTRLIYFNTIPRFIGSLCRHV
jgi:hypothetical protein